MNDIYKNNMKIEQIQNRIDSINSIIDNNYSLIDKYYTENHIKALNRELDKLYMERENIKIQNKYISMNKDVSNSNINIIPVIIFVIFLFIIFIIHILGGF